MKPTKSQTEASLITQDPDWFYDELLNPEMCYRRGFHHGAWMTLQAVSELLPFIANGKLHAWMRQVEKWRQSQKPGSLCRPKRYHLDREVLPPRPPKLPNE